MSVIHVKESQNEDKYCLVTSRRYLPKLFFVHSEDISGQLPGLRLDKHLEDIYIYTYMFRYTFSDKNS